MLTFCDRLGMVDTNKISHPNTLIDGARYTLAPSSKLVRGLWGVSGTLKLVKVDVNAWRRLMGSSSGMKQKPPEPEKWVLTFDKPVGNMRALQHITPEMVF